MNPDAHVDHTPFVILGAVLLVIAFGSGVAELYGLARAPNLFFASFTVSVAAGALGHAMRSPGDYPRKRDFYHAMLLIPVLCVMFYACGKAACEARCSVIDPLEAKRMAALRGRHLLEVDVPAFLIYLTAAFFVQRADRLPRLRRGAKL